MNNNVLDIEPYRLPKPVELANGKTLEIRADKKDSEKVLTNVSFNGKKLEKPFVKVRDIFNGGTLIFDK